MSHYGILLYRAGNDTIVIRTTSSDIIQAAKNAGAQKIGTVSGFNISIFEEYRETLNPSQNNARMMTGRQFMSYIKSLNRPNEMQRGNILTYYEWPQSQKCMDCVHGRFINGEGFEHSEYSCEVHCRENDGVTCPQFEQK